MLRLSLLFIAATSLTACMSQKPQTGLMPTEMHADYRMRHPILVSNQRAYLPHQCGTFAYDLGTSPEANRNRPDFNHACATQHNLAAMIKNPNDLITPRTEGEMDARRRQQIITRYREGTDPGIPWRVDNQNRVATGTGN